jgi:two-component system LytT family response regulator
VIRILLVDDEDLARASMRQALAHVEGFAVVGEAAHGLEALEAVAELKPDVVFLDIEMPGLDGFEVVQQLPPDQAVVFVTAWDEYAVRAFEANAIDYLLKPVQSERLNAALQRVKQRLAAPNDNVAERAVASHRAGPLRRLAARRGKRIVLVPIREIIRIEIEEKLVFAVTASERWLVEKTIGELEALLEPAGFLRINRGELVNLEMVKELLPWFSGTWRVKLANGEERDVSREKARALKEAIGVE